MIAAGDAARGLVQDPGVSDLGVSGRQGGLTSQTAATSRHADHWHRLAHLGLLPDLRRLRDHRYYTQVRILGYYIERARFDPKLLVQCAFFLDYQC